MGVNASRGFESRSVRQNILQLFDIYAIFLRRGLQPTALPTGQNWRKTKTEQHLSQLPEVLAFEAYKRARGTFDTLPEYASGELSSAALHDIDNAQHQFMITPASLPWVLFEKFQAFTQEVMHPDYYDGSTDAHGWLATLRADAIFLAQRNS